MKKKTKQKLISKQIDFWGVSESLAEQYNIYFPTSHKEMLSSEHFYPYISNPEVISHEDLVYCIEDEFGRGFIIGLITEYIRHNNDIPEED